jgi:hypothetical protein
MSRARVVLGACSATLALALLLVLCAPAIPAGAASASQPPASPPLLLPASIPPDLSALEEKTRALQVTSLRMSLRTSFDLAGKGFPKAFAKLLDFSVEGVETVSPPAAAVTVVLFGVPLRLRVVGSHVYLFSWALGRHDGGHPWVQLEKGPFGKLLGGSGNGAKGPVGPSGEERFGALLTYVNEGKNIRELPASILDGQAVTGFEEEPEGSKVPSGASGALGAFSASAGHKPKTKPKPKPKPIPKPKTTLQIYFAASGAPVRVLLTSGVGRSVLSVLADYPAINFPYTIPPPPPGHVISERELRKLFPPRHRSRRVVIVKSKQ